MSTRRPQSKPSNEHTHSSDDPSIRVEAIEKLLVARGLVDSERIDSIIARYAADVGPLNGAKVVARAWTDGAYRERLLEDGTAAVQELGFDGLQMERLVVKENTQHVHNVVCCTLCSCYPWAVLGLPPAWYKSPEYRARIVREPRRVLAELGLDLSLDVELRVWDSSAEIRYLVLPQQPAAARGLSEEEQVDWVTRDAMIGISRELTAPTKATDPTDDH